MKRYCFLMVVLPIMLFSYELGMLNISAPSVLERKAFEFSIQHRFYGVATNDALSTLFGIDLGANVSEGIRYAWIKGMETGLSYTRDQKEYKIVLSYSHLMPTVRSRIDIEFYGYKETDTTYIRNFFPQATFQGVLLNGDLKPIATVGYDIDKKKVRLGVGLSATMLKNIGWYVKEIGLFGEYYPVIKDNDAPAGVKNCFAFGFGFRTYGHQFMFSLGNTYGIGTRNIMMGTDSNDLHLGFNIRRMLGA